jgi:hypothetical protein
VRFQFELYHTPPKQTNIQLHTTTTIAEFEVCTFHDSNKNTIKYLFSPSKRLDNSDEGPVMLDQIIETFDPEIDLAPSSPFAKPNARTEMFRYRARDSADVTYQSDPNAHNGKQYVVAIHREPGHCQSPREVDLAVDNEGELRDTFKGSRLPMGWGKRSVLRGQTPRCVRIRRGKERSVVQSWE